MRNNTMLGYYAGFVTRAAAILLDMVIIIAAIVVINAVISLPLAFFLRVDIRSCVADPQSFGGISGLFCRTIGLIWWLVILLTGPIYFIFFFTVSGQTIGKYVMGVRIVRMDGRPMTVKTSISRLVGYLVSLIPLGFGFVWAIFDNRRLGFHDYLAKTCVIYSWRVYRDDYFLQSVSGWFRRRRRVVDMTIPPAVGASGAGGSPES